MRACCKAAAFWRSSGDQDSKSGRSIKYSVGILGGHRSRPAARYGIEVSAWTGFLIAVAEQN